MQVNRVGQSNQQTNFKGMYLKLKGKWLNVGHNFDEIPAKAVERVYREASDTRNLVLSAKKCVLTDGEVSQETSVDFMQLLLTEDHAYLFGRLEYHDHRQYFLNKALQGHINFPEEITIASTNFMA